MKIRFHKRVISLFIVLVTVLVSIPTAALNVFAFKVGDDDSAEEFYYSELYYTYADYLYTNEYFSDYGFTNTQYSGYVLGEYRNTEHYYLSVVSNFIDTVTSPSEIAKYAFDNIASTEYKFNDDIDAANVEFAKAVSDLYTSANDVTNEGGKYVKGMNKVVSTVNKLIEAFDGIRLEGDLEGLEKADMYDIFLNIAFYDLNENCPNLAQYIPDLKNKTYAKIATMTELSGKAADAVDFVSAFTLAFMMQEVQIDLLDDIIEVAEPDSMLYKGMTRLRNQIAGGAVGYFVDTFLGDKVFEEVVDYFAGNIAKSLAGFTWAHHASMVSACVQIVNTVLFKWIMGADYSKYVTANILKTYSDELYLAIKKRADNIATYAFTVDDTVAYESCVRAYISLNNALYKILYEIAKHNDAYNQDFASKTYDKNFTFETYINNIVYILRNTPKEQRVRNRYNGWAVTGDVAFAPHTDDMEDGYIYTDGNFYGSIIVNSDAYLEIPEDMDVTVSETVRVIGYYGRNPGILNVDGSLTVGGNLELVPYRSGYGPGKVALDDFGDTLTIKGNFVASEANACEYITNGTIIFAGNEQQSINNLEAYNITVTNPAGIKYESNVHIYGYYDLHGNPMDNGQYLTLIHEGSVLSPGSDFKKASIYDERYELSNYIICELNIDPGHTLIIPEGVNAGVTGNINVNGPYGRNAGMIDVDGYFTINGDLNLVEYRSGYSSGKIFMDDENDTLGITGNFNGYDSSCSLITDGTVIFCGDEQQEVKNFNGYNVIVSNPCGIKYTTNLSLYGNYDLCGNNLENGAYSTLVYEGATLGEGSNYKNITIAGDTFTLNNDVVCTLSVPTNRKLIITEDADVTIDGDVSVIGPYGSDAGKIDIDGSLTVNGDLSLRCYRDHYTSGVIIMDEADDTLIIKGDLDAYDSYGCKYITDGTVIFAGNTQQSIKNLKAKNIKVTNKYGIKYLTNVEIYGYYDLFGNPIDLNGNTNRLFIGAVLANGSDFKKAIVAESGLVLQNDIICDLSIPSSYTLLIPEGREASITGNVDVLGPYGGNSGVIDIDGKLKIYGDLSLNEYREQYSSGIVFMDEPDDILEITGDLNSFDGYGCQYITDGTVIFGGDSQQTLTNFKAYNVTVLNPEGIKYTNNSNVYGNYDLCGNPLDDGGFYTNIFPTTTFAPGSDYKDVYVYEGTYTLTEDVKCDLTVPTNRKLFIPENTEVTIDGSVTVVGAYGSPEGVIDIDGRLNITNDLVLSHVREHYSSGSVTMDEWDDTLAVAGDFNAYNTLSPDIYAGKVIFNGDSLQTVTNIVAPVIIIENESEEGVVFTTAIKPSVLFNHNNNNFTLYNGGSASSFADFDGDTIKDNLDPEPTVGLPCIITFVSESAEKGSVDKNTIETIGGSVINVTAIPEFKYEFVHWINSNGSIVSEDAEYTFVAKADDTLTAVFTKRKQPITVVSEGGSIIVADSCPEIESEVKVSIVEDNGYVYVPGSLRFNGNVIYDYSFIMPDEPVELTASFERNASYFVLRDKIAEAGAIGYYDYTAESYSALQNVIRNAEAALVNDISSDEASSLIDRIDDAVSALELKSIVSIDIHNIPKLYYGIEDTVKDITFIARYDNDTDAIISYDECTVSGLDVFTLGEQSIDIVYEGFSDNVTVEIFAIPLEYCSVNSIPDQLFTGDTLYVEPEIYCTLNQAELTKDVDYTLEYLCEGNTGTVTIIITGCGVYSSQINCSYNVYCEHVYEVDEYVDSTCTVSGYYTEKCSICSDKKYYETVSTKDLPSSPHNYENGTDTYYRIEYDGAAYLILNFSADTYVENNYDNIFIYDEDENLVGQYTGTSLSGKPIRVEGDVATIRLKTDVSVSYYGFSLDSVVYTLDRFTLPLSDVHAWSEWEVSAEPTVDSTGLKTRHCTECSVEETEIIPALIIPVLSVDNYLVSITEADNINYIRYASGVHTSSSSIRQAEDLVNINAGIIAENTINGVYRRDMPNGGYYTFWVRLNDGSTYLLGADLTNMTQSVSAVGVTITVHDLYGVKDFFIAKGDYNTYREVANNQITRISETKIDGNRDYSYTVYESGIHTVCIRYSDASRENTIIKYNIDVTEPTFEPNGLQLKIGNLTGVKVIRTAYGDYSTSREIKRAEGSRNFTAKNVIKGAESYTIQYPESGLVSVAVEYNDGYIKIYQTQIEKKSPEVTYTDSGIVFSDLDDLYVIRYAPGIYDTSYAIKRASGSKYLKSSAIKDGIIAIENLKPGTYSICVQYNDLSENYYTITIE